MSQQAALAFLEELPSIGNDLPYSPELLARLFSQTGAGGLASLAEVAATIEQDQGLAARILGVANSAYYGLQAGVGSVARAAAVLGMKEIRQIILAVGLRELTAARPLPRAFDLEAYWRHQYAVAALCRSLAEDADEGEPDDLFTAGLLHDLGKLVVALYRPVEWAAMSELAEEEGLADAVAEDRFWGVDHAVVGALLLKSWSFPRSLVEAVNWHHAPRLADVHQGGALLLRLADAVVHGLDETLAGAFAEDRERIVAHGCEHFHLNDDELAERCEEVLQDEDLERFVALLA
jgi:putative nucleotidyltransferase with HDIG domain